MVSISVGDVFSRKFFAVNENDPLSRCVELFKKEMPPVLAVLDDKGKYIGVITSRWILRSRLDPSTAKVKTLMRPAPRATLDMAIGEAAKLMIEGDTRELPVFEKNKLAGFVTDEHIIHGALTQEWGNTKVENIMTKAPQVINADRSVGAVLSLFREYGISHVPVIEKGQPVGIITTQDIIEHIFQPQRRQTLGDIVGEKASPLSIPAKGIMTTSLITVQPDASLREAEKEMHDSNVSCLIVMSKDKLVGIITKLDFLEPIAQLEMGQRRLTIQFAAKNMEINPDQRNFMMAEFDSFTRKYKDALKPGTLFVYMKTHGTNHKGEQLTHCRLQLRTEKGQYFSSGEGFGIEPTFRVALDRLDRRILRSKELGHEPKYAEDFMRRIGFPTEET
jgi:predicted transcriptional regulator/ribosome-associated translation inhibitor RaiA